MSAGASASPTGLSQAEPEVSALRASIPSADLLLALENICANTAASAYIDVLHAGQVKRRTRRLGIPRETYAHEYAEAAQRGVQRYLWPQLVRLAQGIEAGTAETQSGSVHENPVPKGDAPQ